MTNSLTKYFSNKGFVFGLLIIVPLILFFKSLYYDFSPMDEQWLIVRKFDWLKNTGNFSAAFTTSIGELYYRPLLTISLMLNAATSGLNPFSYHLTNLILHIFCVLSLYKLLTLLKTNNITAVLLSLVFAVHPGLLHGVVWIPGRNDVILCLFMLLSLISLVQYINQNKAKFLVYHFLFFILALLTKENAILFPVIYVVLFLFAGNNKKKTVLLSVLWIGFVIAWYFVKISVINSTLGTGKGFGNTLLLTLQGILMYAGKTVFPFSNSISPTVNNTSFVYGGLVIVLSGLLFYRLGAYNKKTAWLGLLLFFITLVIPSWYGASSPIGEQYEHRIYCPLIGFIILIGQLKTESFLKLSHTILAGFILLLGVASFLRMGVYKTQFSYLEEGVEDCPENYFFHFQKATILYQSKKYNEAVPYFNSAIQLQPGRPYLLVSRANNYSMLGMKNEAITDLSIAYERSKDPEILLNRFNTYKQFGDMANAMNDWMILKQYYGKDIDASMEPGGIKKLSNDKLDQINELIAKEPNRGILYVNRAKAYMDLRMGKEALADLKKACELEPNNQQFKSYYNELNSSLPH